MVAITDRPRSLVSHIKHLAGVEPLMARLFIEGSCDAARDRLGIRPVRVKRSRKTTREGRHIVIKVGDGATGESALRLVRRRNVRTGRHTFVQVTDKTVTRHARRRKPIRVYQYTADQVGKILKEARPRKKEYKEIKVAALAALEGPKPKMRMLPRHTKWSKRRNRR